MRRTTLCTGALALLLSATPGSDESLSDLEHELTRTWRRGEVEDIGLVSERVAAFTRQNPEEARAHYLLGLAELLGVVLTNGSPDSTQSEATVEALGRARAHFERAYELESGHADACASIAFCILQRFMLGRASADEGPQLGEWLQRAQAADGSRASVRVLALWLEGSRGAMPDAQVDAWMSRWIELGESILDAALESEAEPEFWDLFALGLVGRSLVFAPRPRTREAALLAEATLELAPDFHMARAFLLPFVTEREPLALESHTALEWLDLGEDPAGDGMVPGLADATAVSHSIEGEHLWVRIQLAGAPNEKMFGVNLVIDSDDDPDTGSPWWGGGSTFSFDRLVSVWVSLDDEHAYRGAVGITDDRGAFPGEMTKLGDGNVGFAPDVEGQAIVLRVPWSALTDADSLRFVAAVGSNSQWNDNVPDQGSFVLAR